MSNSDTSTSQPRPVSLARRIALTMPMTAIVPALKSTIESPALCGGEPGSPVKLIQPA